MRRLLGLAGLLLFLATPGHCLGWGYQGHILITRLAALRIIDDPKAPAGLKDFLTKNMPYSLGDCRSLALETTVGFDVPDEYQTGLDQWCIKPDQLRYTPEGKTRIEPYGAAETDMHFLDLEAFSTAMAYRDDLSNKPNVDKIPHDLHDHRWKRAGFVPWRVEEMYHKLIGDFGPGAAPADADAALKDAGFLAHYVEDSTNPHHATVDFKSVSYLPGRIPQLPRMIGNDSAALAAIHLPRSVDPHADFEFQLFANGRPPRDAFRREFWKDLTRDIDQLAASGGNSAINPASFDPFRWDLHHLGDAYDYLPLIGRAARAAYESGTFDAQIFFAHKAKVAGKEMSIVELIALQNAKAVLDVEQIYRLAWAAAHSGKP
jgi:hypothetical protein